MKKDWKKTTEEQLSAMPFAKRQLVKLMIELDISGAELARLCNRSSVYITSVGDEFSSSTMRELKKSLPNLNLEWLITGEGVIMENPTKGKDSKSSEDVMQLYRELRDAYNQLVKENTDLKIELALLKKQ